MAAHELKEHADDPKFDALVRRLIEDIRHHVEDEDSDLLPKLGDAWTRPT